MTKPKQKKRPAHGYTHAQGVKVCKLVAEGSNLQRIGNDTNNNLPARSTLYLWLRNVGDFAELYAPARTARAASRADRIDDITARVESGKLEANIGRVLIDTEKWQASKEQPRVYGDKHIFEGGDKPILIEDSGGKNERLEQAKVIWQALAAAKRDGLVLLPDGSVIEHEAE